MSRTLAEEHFGARLVAALDERGMTRRKLANALHVSPETVTNWTRGTFQPRHRRLGEIAEALGTSIADLTGEGSADATPAAVSTQVDAEAREIVRRLAALAEDPAVESLPHVVPRLMELLGAAQRHVDELNP